MGVMGMDYRRLGEWQAGKVRCAAGHVFDVVSKRGRRCSECERGWRNEGMKRLRERRKREELERVVEEARAAVCGVCWLVPCECGEW
jgi:hypothetical protein